jgi:dipeptidyl-peptidase 4
MGTDVAPSALPFQTFEFTADGRAITFDADNASWTCDLSRYRCVRGERPAAAPPPRNSIVSPDGRLAAFIRDHDIWVRHLGTGQDTRLTTDGAPHHGYATDSQGWSSSDRPILLWSPDSRMIATYRLDERGVEDTYLLETAEPRPRLRTWKYALPGDSIVPMLERVVLHLDGPRVVRLQTEPDHQRTSSCCGMTRGPVWADVEWSRNGRSFAFVSTSRDYREVKLRIADPMTGRVRTVLEENHPQFFESSIAGRGLPNWRVLHEAGEFIWFSQRDGWGHLYLYDLETGQLRNRITTGDWNVLDILHIDTAGRWLYFTGVGRETGRDPYFRHLYRVRLDGSRLALLTPEDADHEVIMAPSAAYFVHTQSRMDRAPVTVLRRADGRLVRELEQADISQLLATGWPWPQPFTAKARDGVTDIYGVLHKPSTFDPDRKYPIINAIYPGPQAGSVGTRSFSPARRGEAQALAELGFIVVSIDALGTPMRSKEFHTAYYGDLGDNGLPDQIAAMRQLAERYPWIDLDRVGIFGHSGGGFASAGAILRYPDFFHVAVAGAGNHDNRGYTYYWGEKWHGPLERGTADGPDNYASQANHLLAGNLKGKLLLSYGTMDGNVHPNTTLLLINELIRHNKDFDVMVLPNRGHGYAGEWYMVRRTWDYFMRHLLGKEPPHEFSPGR